MSKWQIDGSFVVQDPGSSYATSARGNVIVPGKTMEGMAVTAVTGDATMTAADMIGGIYNVTASTTTIPTPTAAQIIAAIPGLIAETSFVFRIRNNSGGSVSLAAGDANVTLNASNTNTIANLNTRIFVARVTSSTAVQIYSVGVSAH